ncbi:ion channel protein [Agromyces mediolanus]|uniref:ion channel protein n=1 Tax=Agromyces mediolanus TaxID=41986 RepID=UPI00203DF08A|nr:ion channel protein [Agromyces mediolanus]MCM3657557.1 ion channel protein [Agromyces mediolanus]
MQATPAFEAPGTPTVRRLLLLSIPALVIGIVSAVVLWLVDLLAEQLHVVLWELLPGAFGADAATPWWILVVLTATGAAVGLVVQFVPGHAGVDSATTELDAPPMPILVVPGLLVAVTLSLAGGVSLGPENPIIAINTALAVTLLARSSKAVPQQLVVLLAVSATIGALFGTPVAAALVLTGTVAAVKAGGALWDKLFLPLAAAGAGAVTMHLLGGSSISFTVSPMGEVEPVFVLTGLVIAAGSALAGILAAWLLPILHRAFHSLKHPLLYTTLGGLALGVLGMIGGPMTLFKGLEQTGELIEHPERYAPAQLALFAGIKIVALVVAAAAGFRGGRIFPAVFIGVALGLLGYALIPGVPMSLAIACGALGIVLAATKDGWIAIFVAVALVGDPLVLPLLCVIVLPVWLIVTKAPELVVHPRGRSGPEATAAPAGS